MPHKPSASFPSYFERRAPLRDAVVARRLGRVVLAAWAAGVYIAYWLTQLGLGRVGGR
jgi:hypothetical protein